MKYLYKYTQKKYPYEQLAKENANRSRLEPEYEIFDAGSFDDNRYFDIFIEMAKDEDNEEELLLELPHITVALKLLLYTSSLRFGSEIHGAGELSLKRTTLSLL